MGALVLPRDALDAVIAHARAEAPNECCGLLVGRGSRVARAVRARNALASPTRFLVDPRDHFAAIRAARGAGLQVIGAYHSHVSSPAEPSPLDVERAHDPELAHLIVSLAETEPDVQAYRMGTGRFERLALSVEDAGV